VQAKRRNNDRKYQEDRQHARLFFLGLVLRADHVRQELMTDRRVRHDALPHRLHTVDDVG